MQDDNYSAKSIKMLTEAEAAERFNFIQMKVWIEKYPGIGRDFIARVVEAAKLTATQM